MWFFAEYRPVLNLSWLETRLAGDGPPIIIDGGMGTELQRAGGKPQAFLASVSGGFGGWQVKKVYPPGW